MADVELRRSVGDQIIAASRRPRTKIDQQDIKELPPNSEIWDSEVTGFGARRQHNSAIAYIVLYRTAEGLSRRFTIGRHGAPWTPQTARVKARQILRAVALGRDPAHEKRQRRLGTNVSDLILVTCAFQTETSAERAAEQLVTKRLAADVRVTTTNSHFRWEGEQKQVAEFVLEAKTAIHLFDKVASKLKKYHDYNLPGVSFTILAGGTEEYLQWILSNLALPRPKSI